MIRQMDILNEIDSQELQSAKAFFTDSTYFVLVIHKLLMVLSLYLCLERDGVPLLPSSRPIIKLQICFQSVLLKAVISGAGHTTQS